MVEPARPDQATDQHQQEQQQQQPPPPSPSPPPPPPPPEATPLLLVLMRGVPGSGKSTVARAVLEEHGSGGGDGSSGSGGGVILSTDDYFTLPSGHGYWFDSNLLPEAHAWNQRRAAECFDRRVSPLIIDNTHVAKWEALPYVRLAMRHGYTIRVEEGHAPWWKERDVGELANRNTHGVPTQVIQTMLERWEDDFSAESLVALVRSAPPRRQQQQQQQQQLSSSARRWTGVAGGGPWPGRGRGRGRGAPPFPQPMPPPPASASAPVMQSSWNLEG